MAPITTRSLGLSSLVSATLLFSAGVVSANRVKHFIASHSSSEEVPYVNLEYTSEGTFIDKQRYTNGKVGGVRCDWKDLDNTQRNTYTREQLTRDQTAILDYYHSLSREATENLVYGALARMARADATSVDSTVKKMKSSYGFRWEIDYKGLSASGLPK